MRRFAAVLPYLIVAILLWCSVPPWPDDWDGLGFVASIRRFDLESFAPHPPGYPVYVALLRVASWSAPTAISAANAVAVGSALVALVSLTAAAKLRFSAPGASLAVFLATVATPLVWRCSTAIGSEAPALAFASLAVWGLARQDARGAWMAGAFLGLGLGVRASWAPLLLPMVVLARPQFRWRAVGAALVAVLVWAIPFASMVGPRLPTLLKTQLLGHALRWGGTAITEPARVHYLARDLFVDGFGAGTDGLGLAIYAAGATTAALALLVWHGQSWRGWKAATIVLVPYLVWIAIGQNLRQQPRHALPIVVALSAALAVAGVLDRRTRASVVILFALAGLRSATDAYQRRRIPPTGMQLLTLVRGLPDPSQVMVFGGPSARFFENTELAPQAKSVASLGDALLALGQLDRLPARVFLTSEVERVDEPGYRFDAIAVLSRPPRIDRRLPTLAVAEMHASFLPHR